LKQGVSALKKVAAARLSVISNSFLIALKLAVGLTINSVSVISEAIHSGMDLMAALIALFAVSKSDKPPDAEHQYGHGKIENLSGVIEAILIFAVH
jgi:cation diffusion facilitator family transporter